MKRMLFMIALIYAHSIIPEEPTSIETPGTIILNINLSNVDNSRMVNDARVDTQQNFKQFAANEDNPSLPTQNMQSFLMSNVKDYKWHIAGAIALGSYGLLCYYAIKGNHYLKRDDLWSSWRKDLAINDLLMISQQKFAQDLSQEIYRRYNVDFTAALVLFIKAIDQEEKDLKWYQSFYAWINSLHIQRLVFIDKALYEQIAQRLQKIAYYKGCIEYMVEKLRYC